MRACLLTTNYPPVGGGVSRYNAGLVTAAQGLIEVAGRDFLPPPPPGNGTLARLRQLCWAFRVSVRLPRFTVLLASQPHLAAGAWLSRRKFAMFIHGGEWENYYFGQGVLRRFATRATVCVFSSEATMKRFMPHPGHTKHLVIKPGLSENVPIKSSEQVNQFQAEPALRVLCVGRLSPRKGHRKLIGAVQRCWELNLNVSLTCVGSGDLEAELRSLIRPGDPIRIATNVGDEELLNYYDESDLFAMVPEEITGGEAWEGFGIVYLEAAARGLPIIGTNTGGVPEATCVEGALLLEQSCTADELARALAVLYNQPQRRRRMSLANLRFAGKNSWSSRQDAVIRLLDLLSGGQSGIG